MQKTKLGISVGALAAAIFITGIFNTTAMIILAGYALLMESNPWLKKAAVKAVVIVMGAVLITYATDFINDVLAIPNYIIKWFDDSYDAFQLYIPLNILSIIDRVVVIGEFALLAVCAIKAPKQGTLKFGPLDKFIDKIIIKED